MKRIGEPYVEKVVERSYAKVECIVCDECGKEIFPTVYRKNESEYIKVHTWHNDWGSESIESHEHKEMCKSCAAKYAERYIETATGTMSIECETEWLFDGSKVVI